MSFKFTKSNLNFDVYTVASKPTAPGANNDIAIITSVPMPNWTMSPDKPSGIPRSEGDVWIRYSVTGDTFNAFKNNTMMIATIAAWQYVDGVWVDVEAVSYQNGEWVDWISDVYLFNNGDKCTDVTGGWVAENYHSGYTAAGGSVVFNSDHMVINAVPNGSISAITSNRIDLGGYSKLRILAKTTHGGYSVVISDKFPVSDFASTRDVTMSKTDKENVYVDLSTLNGEYRIAITSVSGGVPLYIYEVELQK